MFDPLIFVTACFTFFVIGRWFQTNYGDNSWRTRATEIEHQEQIKLTKKFIRCYKDRLNNIKNKLEEIVVTEGCDRGVFLVSTESRFHDEEYEENGVKKKVSTYDNECFTPLGDALIDIYDSITDTISEVKDLT